MLMLTPHLQRIAFLEQKHTRKPMLGDTFLFYAVSFQSFFLFILPRENKLERDL